MSKETNRTNNPDRTRVTPTGRYDERHRLTPTTSVWAAVPLPVLLLLQHEDIDRAIRVLFYLIQHSWAMLIPPANYRGDGVDRDDWRPSTFAVHQPQKPGKKARSPFWALAYIRAKDIANDLGLDEGNVSKELKWLGDRGTIRTDQKGRPIFPIQVLDVPTGLAGKKLSTSTTSDFQHPYFQQLLDLRLRIEAEYEEAKREALAPVVEAYRPAFEKVNTQERELRKAAKKAKREGVDLSQVVKVDNLESVTLDVSTKDASAEAFRQVVKVDNSKPLSPIRRVVKVDNFLGRIKSLGKDTTNKDNNNTPPASVNGVSVVVAPVLAALQEHGTTTEAAAKKFILRCQEAEPQCSGVQIVQAIQDLAAGFSKNTKNPIGVLITQVPATLKETAKRAQKRPPAMSDDLRRQLRSSDQTTSTRAARLILEQPDASDQDRADAREVLQALQTA